MVTLKRIKVRNIMGVDELEIEPGKVTLLEGGNATGKSSVLEAVKMIVDGGHDATLLRQGAEEGEAVLLLEDVGEDGSPGFHDGVEIRKRVTREKSDLRVKHPKTGTVSGPKGYVESLLHAASFNPVQFMTSDDRVEVLLQALDPELDPDELAGAVEDVDRSEVDVTKLLQETEDLPALDAIEHVRSGVYDARTGVNRVAREKRTTAKQLEESLPADGADPAEIRAELSTAEHQLAEERQEMDETLERVRKDANTEIERIQDARDAEVAALQQRIEEVRQEAAEEIHDVRSARDASVEEVEQAYREEIDQRQDLASTLRERLQAAESAEGTRQNIRDAKATADEHEEQSQVMTAALERLDALKEKVLEDLPIDGAEIRDGELYVDGIHFERLNSQRRAELSVEVAEMLAGELGLIIVDDLELLDQEHFDALVARLEASRLTALITRVAQDGGDLTVRKSTEAER